MFTQEWRRLQCSLLSPQAKNVLRNLEVWIISWITTIEKPYQYSDSISKFDIYLKNNRKILGEETFKRIDKLTSMMNVCSSSWAYCYKKKVMDLEQHTTSICESLNNSLKQFTKSPMASLTFANSAVMCINHSDKLLKKRKMHNEQNISLTRQIIFGDISLNLLTRKAQCAAEELMQYKVRIS